MPMERRGARNVNQTQQAPDICADGYFKGYERLHWIHSAAAKNPGLRCTNLIHHINLFNLRRAFLSLDGSKATGIDNVRKSDYAKDLDLNLTNLFDEIRAGGWRPKPSREVLIPKPQGGTRPLAIGCLEDKIVQNLVAKILTALYEPQFFPYSYGFRPGKSAHQAVGHLYRTISRRRTKCIVVEMDIEKFFNSVSQDWLMDKLQIKIGDAKMLRLIRRMLRNSVLHADGQISENERGTPQGSPLSPVLANICLHYLLDEWFQKNYAQEGEMIRYADDAVFVFYDEATAQDFLQTLNERMKEAGLNLNSDKSQIVRFSGGTAQGTVGFLGFEYYWGRGRRREPLLKIKTSSKKQSRAITAFSDWIKSVRNRLPTKQLWKIAASKLQGHYNYFGVRFNSAKLSQFYWCATGALYKWLNRRSQKRSYDSEQFRKRIFYNPLPKPPLSKYLRDLSIEQSSERNHKPKSRMRKLRTSGSERSVGWKHPAFT
jgi:RNA-directed DNA polymerase